jgi:molybdenum cofactor sulfurtransferase
VVMAEEHCLGTNLASHLRQHVTDVQTRLLRMFNTSKSAYSVVFTTSYRTAYRLVANAYPFRKNSPVLVCQDNHECVRQVQHSTLLFHTLHHHY